MQEEYKKLIEGKRVIFVGACPNIKGLGKGVEIDNYDVVVKTNGSILLKGEDYYRDYGRRCDVLYTNNQFQRETRPLPIKEWKDNGLQYLCMKTVNEGDIKAYSKVVNTRTFRKLINNVNSLVGSAYMGCYIYTDILRFEPAELFITGVDFFSSKRAAFKHDDYSEYLDGYLPDKIRIQGNNINKGKTKDGHNFEGNAKYIYSLFQKHENLKTEPFIYDLLVDIISGKVGQR